MKQITTQHAITHVKVWSDGSEIITFVDVNNISRSDTMVSNVTRGDIVSVVQDLNKVGNAMHCNEALIVSVPRDAVDKIVEKLKIMFKEFKQIIYNE